MLRMLQKKTKTFQSHISTETSVRFHSLTYFEQHVASERRQWVGLKETQRNLRNILFYTATLSIDQRKKAEQLVLLNIEMEFFSAAKKLAFRILKETIWEVVRLSQCRFFLCYWNWKAQSENLSCVYSLHLRCCQHAFQLPRVAAKVLFYSQQAHIPV